MGQKQSTPAEPPVAANTTTTSSNDPAQHSAAVAAEVERQSQPPPEDARHTYGQPTLPPHHGPSSTTSIGKKGASKLVTDCRKQQRASLTCIEDNYANKNEACAHLFEEYKRCRREEHERKLEANAKASAW
ncbi:hypothetical protein ACHAXT_008966 [Thalassiosira profunda]